MASVLAVVVGTTSASAQEAPPRAAPIGAAAPGPEAASRDAGPLRWIGWQVLLADVPGYAIIAASNPFTTELGDHPEFGMMAGGVGIYTLAAPIVHFANGQLGRGLGSLGMRLGMVTAGAFTGIMAGGCHDYGYPEEHDSCADAAKVTLGAMVVASVVDAAVLSWDRAPAPAVARRPRAAPVVAAGPGRVTVGVSGSF